jgi:hypothetical protein
MHRSWATSAIPPFVDGGKIRNRAKSFKTFLAFFAAQKIGDDLPIGQPRGQIVLPLLVAFEMLLMPEGFDYQIEFPPLWAALSSPASRAGEPL